MRAYLIGRIYIKSQLIPLAVALLNQANGVKVDAVLLKFRFVRGWLLAAGPAGDKSRRPAAYFSLRRPLSIEAAVIVLPADCHIDDEENRS